ncbi:MAG: TrbC/VirB2 family protein [Clostridia bacterium]|nr:TrbC/VirB2 family protein [Clostridia bacterium]
MKKMLMIVMIIAMFLMASSVYAYNLTGVQPSALSGVEGTAIKVLGVMQWGGYIVAIAMLIWVGVKYVTAGAGEKAKAKETLVPIVVGAVLIAGAVTIASAVFGAAST